MNKIEESLSQSKYAEHRNATKGYIGRLVKKGRLPLIKGKLYESNVPWSDYSGNHLQINLDSNP